MTFRDRKDVLGASCLLLGFAALFAWEVRALWVDLHSGSYREAGGLALITLCIMAGMGLLALLNGIAGLTGFSQRRVFDTSQAVCCLNVALAAVVLPFPVPPGWKLAASGIAVAFVGAALVFFSARRPDVTPSRPVTWILRGLMLGGCLMGVGGALLHHQQLREEARRKADREAASGREAEERRESERREQKERNQVDRSVVAIEVLYLDDGSQLRVLERLDPGPESKDYLCTLLSGDQRSVPKARVVDRATWSPGSPPVLSIKQQWAVFERMLAEAVREDRPEDERRKAWEALRGQELQVTAKVLEVNLQEGERFRVTWESHESYAVDVSVRPPARKKLVGTAEGDLSRVPKLKAGGGACVVIRPGAEIGTLDLRGSIE